MDKCKDVSMDKLPRGAVMNFQITASSQFKVRIAVARILVQAAAAILGAECELKINQNNIT